MNANAMEELACRAGDGLEVKLLWAAAENRLTVSVIDARTGESFKLRACADEALEVFYHPFAYAAQRR